MTIEQKTYRDFHGMVDVEKGTVQRLLFSDPEIHRIELERIFARAWNFMAHDSQIPNPGTDRTTCDRRSLSSTLNLVVSGWFRSEPRPENIPANLIRTIPA